jgi:16S rRNA (cytosine1402-N4)-methyltransferase
VGAGGHAAGILEASAPKGKLLGLDVDPEAIQIAAERLAGFGERVTLVRASYVTLPGQLDTLGWDAVDGALLDLGASSMQFDRPERGFSFQADGPLDMRFDPDTGRSAADLVNELTQTELADLIYRYGDEKRSRQIAKAIVQARPLESTAQLAKVVSQAAKRKPGGLHPATQTFQALRIAVNGELDAIEATLPQMLAALKPGGCMAVISFHSLEDRLVKQFFQQESRSVSRQPDDPPSFEERTAKLKIITRRPIRAAPAEVEVNPRARSARLRVAEKI